MICNLIFPLGIFHFSSVFQPDRVTQCFTVASCSDKSIDLMMVISSSPQYFTYTWLLLADNVQHSFSWLAQRDPPDPARGCREPHYLFPFRLKLLHVDLSYNDEELWIVFYV